MTFLPFFLGHGSVDSNSREVLFMQQLCKGHTSLYTLHKYDYLEGTELSDRIKYVKIRTTHTETTLGQVFMLTRIRTSII